MADFFPVFFHWSVPLSVRVVGGSLPLSGVT